MNKTKIIGVVLALHGLIIALLLFPGCKNRKDPPSPTDAALRSGFGDGVSGESGSRTPGNAEANTVNTASSAGGTPASNLQPPRRPTSWQFKTSEPGAPEPVSQLPESSGFNDNLAPEPVAMADTSMGPSVLDVPGGVMPNSVASLEHTVVSGDSLWKIANAYGVSLDALLNANTLTKNSVIRPGQKLIVPGASGASAPSVAKRAETKLTQVAAGSAYTVQKGDTLSGIAYRNGTTVAAIRSLNGLSSDVIRVGQQLQIPGDGVPRAPRQKATTTAGTSEIVGGSGYHEVKAGESPSVIAAKYGMRTDELMRLNGIDDPRKLRVGQRLIVSGAALEAAKSDLKTRQRQSRSVVEVSGPAPRVEAETDEPEPLSLGSPAPAAEEPVVEETTVGDPFEELYEPEDSEIPVLQF